MYSNTDILASELTVKNVLPSLLLRSEFFQLRHLLMYRTANQVLQDLSPLRRNDGKPTKCRHFPYTDTGGTLSINLNKNYQRHFYVALLMKALRS